MASHSAAARAKGANEAQINELYAVVALANMTNRLANAYKVPVDAQFIPKDEPSASRAKPAARSGIKSKRG
jgi:hypothetical protein